MLARASEEEGYRAHKNGFRLGCADRISTRLLEQLENQKSEVKLVHQLS